MNIENMEKASVVVGLVAGVLGVVYLAINIRTAYQLNKEMKEI